MNLNLIIAYVGVFTSYASFSNSDDVANCKYSSDDLEIMKLVDSFEAQSRFSAKLEASKIILKRCQELKVKGDNSIIIRDGKVKFTEFSDRYDTSRDAYFCKNSGGYDSYLSQLTGKINLFSRERERKRREELFGKASSTYSSRSTAEVSAKEKIWICRSPFAYIKTKLYLDEARMLDHVNAHGESSCKLEE